MNPASAHGATNVSPLQTGLPLHLSAEPTNALDDKTTDIALNAFAEMISGGLQECASLDQKDITQLSQSLEMGIDFGDDPLGIDFGDDPLRIEGDFSFSETEVSALTAANDSPATTIQENLIGATDELLETSRKEVPPTINSTLVSSDQMQVVMETVLVADVPVIPTPKEHIQAILARLGNLRAEGQIISRLQEKQEYMAAVDGAIALGALNGTEDNDTTFKTLVSMTVIQSTVAGKTIRVLIVPERRLLIMSDQQDIPEEFIESLKHHGIDNTYTITFAKSEDIESFAGELETFKPWLADFLEAQVHKYLEAKKEEAKKQQASEETTPQIRNTEHALLNGPRAIAPSDDKTTSQTDAVLTLATLSSPNLKGTQSRRKEESRTYEETRVRVNEEKRLMTKAKLIEEKRLNQEILKKEIVGSEFRRRAHFKQRM